MKDESKDPSIILSRSKLQRNLPKIKKLLFKYKQYTIKITFIRK